MINEFEMCKRAGLHIFENVLGGAIQAAEIENFLQYAPVVSGHKGTDQGFYWGSPDELCDEDTHTARLILIEPIRPKDTAESLLRELVEFCNGSTKPNKEPGFFDFMKRARRLLDTGEADE